MTKINKVSYLLNNPSDSFAIPLTYIIDNPIIRKVKLFANSLISLRLQPKQISTYIPQVTFAKDGSIGIIRQAVKIRYLVIEGGGFKGFCYPPFIKTLNAKIPFLDDLHEVAGVSAGGIMAFMLACGTSLEAIENHLSNADVNKELWGEALENITLGNFGLFSGNQMIRSMLQLSIKSANEFYKSIRYNLEELSKIRGEVGYGGFLNRAENGFKNGLTFRDLKLLHRLNPSKFKLLNVMGSAGLTAAPYSADTAPNLYCHVAVRASMAIPYAFKPVVINGRHITDGSDITGIPIGIFKGRENFNPEETLALIFDRHGASSKILYGPPEIYYSNFLVRFIARCREIFRNLFYRSLNGSEDLRNTVKESLWRAGKPIFVRWLLRGEHYIKTMRTDADNLYELASNVLIVPHGKGKEALGTLHYKTTPQRFREARQTAIKAAEEYAAWRKDMASYRSYNNVKEAILSLSEDEKMLMAEEVKKSVLKFLNRFDMEKISLTSEFRATTLEHFKKVQRNARSNLDSVFASLKFLESQKG